ncbi:MAG: hypothetical protein MJZ08_05910 [Bacteroidaceae bacterium]|nr:hypothetical protein [Bacteroidaceae bacterium]
MLAILIIITLVLHAVLTLGSIKVWKTVEKTNPVSLAKVFFVSMAVRLIVSVAIFAISLMLMKDDVDAIKLFTILFVIIYFLLLAFDTIYFYCSLKMLNNKKK